MPAVCARGQCVRPGTHMLQLVLPRSSVALALSVPPVYTIKKAMTSSVILHDMIIQIIILLRDHTQYYSHDKTYFVLWRTWIFRSSFSMKGVRGGMRPEDAGDGVVVCGQRGEYAIPDTKVRQ